MLNKDAKAKFKIYKIKENYSIDGIIEDTELILSEKGISYDVINKNNFQGIIFNNKSNPPWVKCIWELMSKNLREKYQENINMSYVLLKESSNHNIYAISGGQGYHILKEYYIKNYGLNLVPKLINNTDFVVRDIIEKRLYGNQIYDHRVNRNNTTLKYEFDFTNIYKELGLIFDKEILMKLNLIDDKHFEGLDYIKFTNKDYIFVEKSLTLESFEYVLDWLDFIDEKPPNFELNSFIPISSAENYKPSEMIEFLISFILDKDYTDYDIEIVGENIVNYHDNDKYIIMCDGINLKLTSDFPILWETVENYFKENSLFDYESLKYFFKNAHIITLNNGEKTLDSEILNCLDCRLWNEKDKKDYFLLDGGWFYLDYVFNDIITEKFYGFYDESKGISQYLVDKYPKLLKNWEILDKKNMKKNENNYNNSFVNDKEIIVAHTLKPDNLEIADLIIYDKNNSRLFLICIKNNFEYGGCRDVYGQIEGSCNYLKNKLFGTDEKIDSFYTSLKNKNNGIMPINKNEFKEILHKSDIIYVAGFIKKYRENPTIPIKILTNITYNSLKKANFKFYLMDFDYENL